MERSSAPLGGYSSSLLSSFFSFGYSALLGGGFWPGREACNLPVAGLLCASFCLLLVPSFEPSLDEVPAVDAWLLCKVA